jgi:Zn-dependent protease
MANYLGDPTAKYEGRLTLNPIKHIDPVGSILVPAIGYLSAGVIFGWAKPVPYNPHNLRPGIWSEALVALAGPFSNLFLAVIFGLLLRFSPIFGMLNPAILHITALIVFVNLTLMIFNLVPIPPLDGSKILFAFLPNKMYELRGFFERYGFILIILFIFYGWELVFPLVKIIFSLITGVLLP